MHRFEKGYSLIAVLSILVIVAVLAVGGMFLLQRSHIIPEQTSNIQPSYTTSQPQEIVPTPTTSQDKGSIEGTFSFPSEEIPSTLIACAENIETKDIICNDSLKESGLADHFMIAVPEGSYYVYAINTADQTQYKAYFTEYVTCGLKASCTSHTKIPVEVFAGKVTKDIKPHDWYNISSIP